ncbi:MAG: hypothetical protein LBK71_03440 [Verrucomicrobiales bacterium]|jgi:hypothetical protein|nr:hypothetical protein [Verrucomicrobiales bacterium]
MFYKPNWDQVQQRYREYWARENHDRPLLDLTGPKAGRPAPPSAPKHARMRDLWCDMEYNLARARWQMEHTYFGAEALPIQWPNLGPDLFAALYGTPLEYGPATSWSLHTLAGWEPYPTLRLDRENFYYRKIIEMTEAFVADARDRYLVGITDIHAGLDALVAMRGPEELCLDALECPDALRRAALELCAGFKTLYDELYAITTRHQRGSTNWLGTWHPGRWYVTSCDFGGLISRAMFDELVVDELRAELAFLDASIFHLDGPGALKQLDRLLAIEELDGIQWVYGAGQPTATHWLDVLRKIQQAGKLVNIEVTAAELPALLEALPPEGVLYRVNGVRSEEEARALEKLAGVEY